MHRAPRRTERSPASTAFVAVLGLSAATTLSCAPLRSAAVATDELRDGLVVVPAPFGAVSCGQGSLCAEVEVARLDVRASSSVGGATDEVELTLRNRTGEALVVQVALEAFAPGGARADRTGFMSVALPARQEQVIAIGDVPRARERLVVHLRART